LGFRSFLCHTLRVLFYWFEPLATDGLCLKNPTPSYKGSACPSYINFRPEEVIAFGYLPIYSLLLGSWSGFHAIKFLGLLCLPISAVYGNKRPAQRTYQIKKLVEQKMLQPIKEGARQYTIGFSNNYLMRGVVRALSNEGFIPATLNKAD